MDQGSTLWALQGSGRNLPSAAETGLGHFITRWGHGSVMASSMHHLIASQLNRPTHPSATPVLLRSCIPPPIGPNSRGERSVCNKPGSLPHTPVVFRLRNQLWFHSIHRIRRIESSPSYLFSMVAAKSSGPPVRLAAALLDLPRTNQYFDHPAGFAYAFAPAVARLLTSTRIFAASLVAVAAK